MIIFWTDAVKIAFSFLTMVFVKRAIEVLRTDVFASSTILKSIIYFIMVVHYILQTIRNLIKDFPK